MVVKGKYKSLYITAFAVFLVINVVAIFFVFKKYKMDCKESQLMTSTKFRYSKVKEKIANIKTKIPQIKDSLQLVEFKNIELEKEYLDSVLAVDFISRESLSQISNKIYDISSKSNHLEQEISLETLSSVD